MTCQKKTPETESAGSLRIDVPHSWWEAFTSKFFDDTAVMTIAYTIMRLHSGDERWLSAEKSGVRAETSSRKAATREAAEATADEGSEAPSTSKKQKSKRKRTTLGATEGRKGHKTVD